MKNYLDFKRRTAYILAACCIFSITSSEAHSAKYSEVFQIKNERDRPELQIGFCSKFQLAWNDGGSGADRNGAFWRPIADKGFFPVGDLGLNHYGNPNGKNVIMVVKDLSGSATKPPVDYKFIWNDSGSGADRDGAFWQPLPPRGYVAMGCVATSGGKPKVNEFRCIRKDLVRPARVKGLVWIDAGSGADRDMGSFRILAASSKPGEVMVSPGTFVTVPYHSEPSNHPCAYCFKLKLVEEKLPTDQPFQTPVLTSRAKPRNFDKIKRVYFTSVPWFAVKDDQLSDVEKIAKSPVYRLKRTDTYNLIQFYNNSTDKDQTKGKQYTSGFSETDTKSFSNTTGISYTNKVETEAPGGIAKASSSLTLSTSFTFGASNSRTSSKEVKTRLDMLVAAGTASAMFDVESTYELFRDDGNGPKVGSELTGNQIDNHIIVSFPRKKE